MPRYSEIEDLDGPQVSPVTFENFFNSNKTPIAGFLIGSILIGVGVFLYKQGFFEPSSKVEIIKAETSSVDPSSSQDKQIVVEISGGVEKPGVYKLNDGARVEDALIAAGGISADADRAWVEKYINRASKLIDGQKLYIMKSGEVFNQQSSNATAINNGGIKMGQGAVQGSTTGLININTASLSELDSLPGIGQVYGQSVIDHRPYSTLDELVSKGAIKQNVYDKIKDKVGVY